MKKKFLNVALLSVIACGAPATFTSCDDDGWKDRTNVLDEEMAENSKLIEQLTSQTKALETQIAQYKQEGDAAAKAADAAKAAADAAQKSGDDAMAAAKAADAAAQLAAKAAADAKAEAAEALKAQYDELIALIKANASEIANNTGKITDNANAIAGILESIKGSDAKIEGLEGTVAGLQAAIAVLNGEAEALGVKVAGIEKAMEEEFGKLSDSLLAAIENSNKADDALLAEINALKGEIDALSIGSNLEKFAEFITSTNTQLDALKKYDEELNKELANHKDLINKNAEAIAKQQTELDAVKAEAAKNAAAITANAEAIAKNAAAIAANTENINKLSNEVIPAVKEEIATINGQVEAINAKLETIVSDITSLNANLVTFVLEQLRGLVFIPETFVGGIESALSYNLTYNTKKQADFSTDYRHNNYVIKKADYSASVYVSDGSETKKYNPVTEVSYHMNPTQAKVEFKDLHIVSNDAEILSRAASSSKAGIALDEKFGCKIADGVLTVVINGNASNYGSDKMPVFALQADVYTEEIDGENGEKTVKKSVVTSDYAMFSQMNINLRGIDLLEDGYLNEFGAAQGRDSENSKEVQTTILGVLIGNVLAKVDYNSSVNLNNLFKIQYRDVNRNEYGYWNSAEEWGRFGLKFGFKLVDYYEGSNNVSESAWASISEDGIFTPCAAGQPGVQSKDALGHKPVVLVTVTDSDGKVVLTGYIKLQIAPTEDFYMADAIAYNNVDFSCDGFGSTEQVAGTATTPKNAESLDIFKSIVDKTGLSKDEFLARYTPDGTVVDATWVMNQYQGEGEFVDYDGIGDVIFNDLAAGDAIDHSFFIGWYLDTEAKQVVYEGKNHAATTYVRWKSNDPSINPDVYVPMTVAVNQKPVVEVGSKMEARWFRNMEVALLNVQQPTNGVQPTTITTDLNLLWQNAKPAFSGLSEAAAALLAAQNSQNNIAGGYRYYFPDVQGEIDGVKLTVTNKKNPCLIEGEASNANMGDHALMVVKNSGFVADGEYSNNVIYADGKKLATLDQATGVITLAETAEAQTLLNKYSSDGDGLDRTNAKLQVKVGVVAYNECGIAYDVKNSVIPATFLRPINIVKANKVLNFTDATDNGSKVDVYGLLDFSDWRGVSFANNEWLFAYYNVKNVEVKLDEMTTNAGTINTDPNKFVKDSSVRAAFDIEGRSTLTYSADNIKSSANSTVKTAVKNAFGKIVYDNTKLNINSFSVRIPVTITYGLGEFTVEVECKVNSTMGA